MDYTFWLGKDAPKVKPQTTDTTGKPSWMPPPISIGPVPEWLLRAQGEFVAHCRGQLVSGGEPKVEYDVIPCPPDWIMVEVPKKEGADTE